MVVSSMDFEVMLTGFKSPVLLVANHVGSSLELAEA